jgi:hypothetical protein
MKQKDRCRSHSRVRTATVFLLHAHYLLVLLLTHALYVCMIAYKVSTSPSREDVT